MKGKFGYQKERKSQQKENRRTNERKSQQKENKSLPNESKSSSKKKTLKHSPAMQTGNKITSIKDVSPMDEHGDRSNPVTENGGRLPILPHDWKLSFYKNTNVTRIDQFDDNFISFKSELFTRILDTNEEYEENNSVYVIGTVVGIGEIVAVNSIDVPAVHNALFGTKLYINKQLSELLTFRQRYESREDYEANKNKIQLVAHETKVVTPQQFMNGAVKKLVGSIRETEPSRDIMIHNYLTAKPYRDIDLLHTAPSLSLPHTVSPDSL
ncbi:hypothetical protein Tco_0417706 [Tanacetum coccineum]